MVATWSFEMLDFPVGWVGSTKSGLLATIRLVYLIAYGLLDTLTQLPI